jgi:hypothetical protein
VPPLHRAHDLTRNRRKMRLRLKRTSARLRSRPTRGAHQHDKRHTIQLSHH